MTFSLKLLKQQRQSLALRDNKHGFEIVPNIMPKSKSKLQAFLS